MSESKWCCRCHEDFPVAPEDFPLRMGYLYPLSRVPERVKRRLHGDKTSRYLCGNCWFDILDELDEGEVR